MNRMKKLLVTTALSFVTAACGGSSRMPMSPSSPATAMSVAGTWVGSPSDSSSALGSGALMGQAGMGAMTWQLTGSGSALTGTINFAGMHGGAAGTFSGMMTDDADFTFTLTMPMGSMMSSGCTAQATGTAHFDGTTMMLTGTYGGSNSCYGSFTNGQFTMTHP